MHGDRVLSTWDWGACYSQPLGFLKRPFQLFQSSGGSYVQAMRAGAPFEEGPSEMEDPEKE